MARLLLLTACLALVGCTHTRPAETTMVAATTTTYSPCRTDGPCVILPLGDSITYGAGSSDGSGYRGPLYARARADGRAIVFVGSQASGPTTIGGAPFPSANEGRGGYTIDPTPTRSGISPLVVEALRTYRPDVVTLMIGTNDMTESVIDAPVLLGRLLDVIARESPRTLVLLAAIVPNLNADAAPRVVAFNAALTELVASRARAGAQVVLVDVYARFADHADVASLFADPVHPNDAGYEVLAAAFYEALRPHLR